VNWTITVAILVVQYFPVDTRTCHLNIIVLATSLFASQLGLDFLFAEQVLDFVTICAKRQFHVIVDLLTFVQSMPVD
jgi:hypothetical protein